MPTVLVTGATGGVGRALVGRLLSDGYDILALGREPRALAELGALAGVEAVAADITDRARLAQLLEGRVIDVLVNNAGMMPPLEAFHDASQEGIDQVFAVNLLAQVALTRLLVPGMVARGSGHILFTGSTAGHAPFPNMAIYCATKAAIASFAQALALDLGETGVRVTEIVAGRVETGLYRDILSPEAREAMYADGRCVQPDDIAEIISAILRLPPNANVNRFDIVPARQTASIASIKKG